MPEIVKHNCKVVSKTWFTLGMEFRLYCNLPPEHPDEHYDQDFDVRWHNPVPKRKDEEIHV